MTAHTPTPWHVKGGWVYGGDRITLLALTPYAPMVTKANAAHIVRCVNAHDALVAALQAVLVLSADVYAIGVDHTPRQTASEWDLRRVQEQARAALRLAGAADKS